MATTLEIIDTAVKIGLGALISGASAYWITRLKHRTDLEKEQIIRHRMLLENVAQQVEEVNHAYLKYCAWMITFVGDKKEGRNWTGSEIDEFKLVKNELFSIFKEITNAEAKLLLLAKKDAYAALRAYSNKVYYFTQDVYGNKEGLKEEFIVSLRSEISELRVKFYEILSECYKVLSA